MGRIAILFVVLGVAAVDALAEPLVTINGVMLTPAERVSLERQLGVRIEPGHYLYNPGNGCWLNTTSGHRGCGVGSQSHFSRYGSGESNGVGDWSHWSDMAGGAVGGTGDGCVYAYGWSNC